MDDPHTRLLIAELKEEDTVSSLQEWFRKEYPDIVFNFIQVIRNKGFGFMWFDSRESASACYSKYKDVWLSTNLRFKPCKDGNGRVITYTTKETEKNSTTKETEKNSTNQDNKRSRSNEPQYQLYESNGTYRLLLWTPMLTKKEDMKLKASYDLRKVLFEFPSVNYEKHIPKKAKLISNNFDFSEKSSVIIHFPSRIKTDNIEVSLSDGCAQVDIVKLITLPEDDWNEVTFT